MDTKECAQMLVNLQVRLLTKLRTKMEWHYLDKPVEDFTEEELGMEQGIGLCLGDINKMLQELDPGDRREY